LDNPRFSFSYSSSFVKNNLSDVLKDVEGFSASEEDAPLAAAIPLPRIMANGVAIPKAQG
jgi:hypothetical protein